MKHSLRLITLSSIFTAITICSSQAAAVEGLTANIAATNNYLWRGVTQAANEPAVSGGIDYGNDSGFYVGTWASNANWAENMTYELDVYAGFSKSITEELSYDVGYIYYGYDSDAKANFSEVYAKLTYNIFTLGYSTLADSEAGGSFGDDSYISGDAEFELSKGLALGLHIGHYSFDAGGDYTDYGISLTKDGFTFGLYDTDIDGADGDLNVVVSYAVDFDL